MTSLNEVRDIGEARSLLQQLENERKHVQEKFDQEKELYTTIIEGHKETNEQLEFEIMRLKEKLDEKKESYKQKLQERIDGKL